MNQEAIYMMMLQVLDDPTSIRIIVNTSYPDFSEQNGAGNAYFMIDHGDCETSEGAGNAIVYDHWKVSDSLSQSKEFKSNAELIDFLESISGLITVAYVESF